MAGLQSIRDSIAAPLRAALGDLQLPQHEPLGDPGLFGPDSVTWRVHGDTMSMLIGGISALLLQTLHPGAMAGVSDHSDFRTDPFGRLHRTSLFVGSTSFGATKTAERQLAVVRKVHERVTGVRPDGLPYAASDPDLLTWVHIAEVRQFLAGHRRYGTERVSAADIDRYFAEVAVIAYSLGAVDVPTSAAEVHAYLARVRRELRYGPQAREAVAFLRAPEMPGPREQRAAAVMFQAAAHLLPSWARALLELDDLWPAAVAQAAAASLARTVRWSLGPSPLVAYAHERCSAPATAAAS